jgi:hypothetical protein
MVTVGISQRIALWSGVEDVRQSRGTRELIEQTKVSASSMSGEALLDVERAFRVGALTIVDAHCWEAMANAYSGFEKLRNALIAANQLTSLDQFDPYIARVEAAIGRASGRMLLVATRRPSVASAGQHMQTVDEGEADLRHLLGRMSARRGRQWLTSGHQRHAEPRRFRTHPSDRT